MKGIYTYNGTEYEFEYKTVLTAMQRLMTIMNIEQSCFRTAITTHY